MVFTGNTNIIPTSVFVYFVFDILFNLETFMTNTTYLLHHMFTCFHIYLAYKYFMDHEAKLGFFIWLQETALVPINLIEIFKMQSLEPPAGLYVLRAFWYGCTRVYSYGFFFYNYDDIFDGSDKRFLKFFCIPLITHNAVVFNLQIKSMLRAIRQ